MASPDRRILIIGADGLRPDMLEPELMPNLFRLMEHGVRFNDHHASYPSHTRVQASTFSTGAHPGTHGIVANTMLVTGATDDHIIDTSNYQHLDQLARHDPTSKAQFVIPLGDIIADHGGRIAVTGTGSPGSNALWTFNERSRIINVHTAFGIADLYDLREKLGQIPEPAIPNIERNHYITHAVTDVFLHDPSIRVITAWFAEPDSSLHYRGLGSPESRVAIRDVDACLGAILDTMHALGIRDQFDILFLSDHGHSTVRAHKSLREFLHDAKQEIGDLPPLATASDYIYAEPGSTEPSAQELRPLVQWLETQSWVDIIAGGRDDLAAIPGVLSLTEIWGGHSNPRRPLLAISPTWSHAPNEHGVPGTVAALTTQGALKSSHGSLSPFDMHATFVASGPSFREGIVSDLPTGAIDVMPTILSVLGIPIPETVEGRPVTEGFVLDGGATPPVDNLEIRARTPGGHDRAVLAHRIGHTTYIHGSCQPGIVDRVP